jgi:hypothetical protein
VRPAKVGGTLHVQVEVERATCRVVVWGQYLNTLSGSAPVLRIKLCESANSPPSISSHPRSRTLEQGHRHYGA